MGQPLALLQVIFNPPAAGESVARRLGIATAPPGITQALPFQYSFTPAVEVARYNCSSTLVTPLLASPAIPVMAGIAVVMVELLAGVVPFGVVAAVVKLTVGLAASVA